MTEACAAIGDAEGRRVLRALEQLDADLSALQAQFGPSSGGEASAVTNSIEDVAITSGSPIKERREVSSSAKTSVDSALLASSPAAPEVAIAAEVTTGTSSLLEVEGIIPVTGSNLEDDSFEEQEAYRLSIDLVDSPISPNEGDGDDNELDDELDADADEWVDDDDTGVVLVPIR